MSYDSLRGARGQVIGRPKASEGVPVVTLKTHRSVCPPGRVGLIREWKSHVGVVEVEAGKRGECYPADESPFISSFRTLGVEELRPFASGQLG